VKLEQMRGSGCNALDVAALWPSTAQLAGLPLPEIERHGEDSAAADSEADA